MAGPATAKDAPANRREDVGLLRTATGPTTGHRRGLHWIDSVSSHLFASLSSCPRQRAEARVPEPAGLPGVRSQETGGGNPLPAAACDKAQAATLAALGRGCRLSRQSSGAHPPGGQGVPTTTSPTAGRRADKGQRDGAPSGRETRARRAESIGARADPAGTEGRPRGRRLPGAQRGSQSGRRDARGSSASVSVEGPSGLQPGALRHVTIGPRWRFVRTKCVLQPENRSQHRGGTSQPIPGPATQSPRVTTPRVICSRESHLSCL